MGRVRRFRAVLGLDELAWSGSLWRALPAEFLGTAVLVLIACGSCAEIDPAPSHLHIALAFGFAVATAATAVGHASGGHLNPAVTAGLLSVGKCSVLRAMFYMVMQCAGALAAAAVLRATATAEGALGGTGLAKGLSATQGLGVEFLISFILVITVCAVSDSNRRDLRGSAPLAVGLSVAACHLWAIKYTGAGMNPARSFGPAVITNSWDNHWVYWVGPILGGVIAALFYEHLFAARPSDEEEERSFRGINEKELVADRTTSI